MLRKEEKKFSRDTSFEYDKISKKVEGIGKIVFFSFIGILLISQLVGLTKGTFIDTILSFVFAQFAGRTLLNVFFLGLIGGLFFLSVPLEIFFINAMHNIQLDSFILGAVFFVGLLLSYLANYFMGYLFSPFATKLMSPQQFYGIKVKLNKYGSWLILIFNLFPLPSQPLTFVCGVFKYNKLRYFSLWTTGWFIKIIILIIVFG